MKEYVCQLIRTWSTGFLLRDGESPTFGLCHPPAPMDRSAITFSFPAGTFRHECQIPTFALPGTVCGTVRVAQQTARATDVVKIVLKGLAGQAQLARTADASHRYTRNRRDSRHLFQRLGASAQSQAERKSRKANALLAQSQD